MDAESMERDAIEVDALPGGLDLYATIESGQSYGWRREDDRCYAGHGPEQWGDEPPWYCRVVDGEVLRVRQHGGPAEGLRASEASAGSSDLRSDGVLEWEATADLESAVRELLRLDDDLPAILDSAPDDPLLSAAIDYVPGLRLVRDPPFETLIAFICSPQMRVARIHGMVSTLAREYGEPIAVGERTYYSFPEPEALAAATEQELRDLGLGYRAPYVVETAEMVADGVLHPADVADLPYEQARERLTEFVGVGDKVADCVLLFSLDFLEAVPLDTWIRQAIAEHYPDCDRGNYAETSRAIRERFGGEFAGYVQTYVFHYLRTRE